uniref:Uncharacterized protein n=1 Tax=Phalansterium sp. PJK-2012 TaxID=1267188 RepID=T1QE06_9EUKA|nr:hypothetical protein [Phalansterium sp. PJK-2012]
MILFYIIISTFYLNFIFYVCWFVIVVSYLYLNFCFKNAARFSLREYTVVLEDIGEKEWSEWEQRSVFTKEELAKMELEENKFIVLKTKMYSNVENKFVDIWVTFLIQQGDKNSLLKRGVYVNIWPFDYRPLFFIRASQFQSAKGKNAKYNDDKESKLLIDPRFLLPIFDAIQLKIETDERNFIKRDKMEINKFLINILAKQEYLIRIENPIQYPPWWDDENEIMDIVNQTLDLLIATMTEIYDQRNNFCSH